MTDGIPLGFKPHPGDFLDKYVGKRRSPGSKHRRPPSLATRAAFASVMVLALAPALLLVHHHPQGASQAQALPQWEPPGVPVPVLEVPARQGLADKPKLKIKTKPRSFDSVAEITHVMRRSRTVESGAKSVKQVTPEGTSNTEGSEVPVPPRAVEPSSGGADTPKPTAGGTCHVGTKLGRWVKTAKALVCQVVGKGEVCSPTQDVPPTHPPTHPHQPTRPPKTTPTPNPTPTKPTPAPTTPENPDGSAPTEVDLEASLNRVSGNPAPQGLRSTKKQSNILRG